MDNAPVALPIDGTLDLHTFAPREIKALVPDYLAACRERGILQVRIIHGKGTGALRRTVHALLARLEEVAAFRQRTAGMDPDAFATAWKELLTKVQADL